MRRGEKEGFLIMRIHPPEEEALELLMPLFVRGAAPAARQVRLAVEDGYKRLLSQAMERRDAFHKKQNRRPKGTSNSNSTSGEDWFTAALKK